MAAPIIRRLDENVKQKFMQYAAGLILAKSKRTCANIAAVYETSHDSIYKVLCLHNELLPIFPEFLLGLVRQFFEEEKRLAYNW